MLSGILNLYQVNATAILGGRYYYAYFIDEQPGAQSGKMICSNSHSL